MAICLLIGNLLLIAVAASNPIYSDAVLQRTLTKTLSQKLTDTNAYPAEVTLKSSITSNNVKDSTITYFEDLLRQHAALQESINVPTRMVIEEYTVSSSQAILQGERSDGKKRQIAFGYLSDFSEHTEIVSGSSPSDTASDGVLEAIVSQRALQQQDLLIGEELVLNNILQPDGVTPYRIKIVGVYRASQEDDLYWNRCSNILSANLIVSEKVFREHFIADSTYPCGISVRRSVYLNYPDITPDQISGIIQSLTEFQKTTTRYLGTSCYENLTSQLESFLPQASKLKTTLIVLQAPIFVLLAAFIFMVSRQMMELEENEIAVLKSRGSGKRQIISLYLLQGLLLSAVGLLLGYPFSFLICRLLGSSNAFLEFVQRSALPVRANGKSVLYAVLAAAASCAATVLPVLRYSGISIVQHKVKKQSSHRAPWWQRIFLDVILLALSLYALYSFHNQQDYLVQQMQNGGTLDPLLYFSSSVFIIGAGLLGMRLLPLLIRLIFAAGKKFWPPSLYAAFLRVLRTQNSQSFIMIFLVLTISLGIFNTTAARSINGNAEDRIRYLNGSDVVVQEAWESAGTAETGFSGSGSSTDYLEPNFEKYRQIPGVQSLTKVYYSKSASVSTTDGKNIRNAVLMGIDTKEFGETANFKTSLMSVHWYSYLNAISQDPRGILVSSSFRDEKGYSLGDVLSYTDSGGTTLYGVIYGFVDYWPAFTPRTVALTSTGESVETTNYLIVANLSQLQASCGVRPYQIWMKMEGSSQPVYDFAQERGIRFSVFRDTAADLISLKNDPVFQGTNGVLTADFIIVLLLCMVGFLIYWILSIRSRELQFGIFRAMGLSMREIISMLTGEQLLISGSSILIGIVTGILATKLYLPLIQIAYSPVDQVLPIEMISNSGDAVRLFTVIAVMIICCMVILAWLISKIRIAQALKLGED
ncbi:MAG: ABC transporter permease [Firmicutes bacterium]|nr:ABC transporter permease [Bacillota bacterium]